MHQGMMSLSFTGTTGAATNLVTSAGTTIIGRAPVVGLGGGLSILAAMANFRGGTAPLTIVDLGADGITPTGTVASITGAYDASTPVRSGSPEGYFLAAGNYLGVVFAAGTIQYPGNIVIQYASGRGAA